MTTEYETNRIPVLPLENTILLHEGRAEIKIKKPASDMIKKWVDEGHSIILAAGLKDEKNIERLEEEDLFHTGVLINIVTTHSDGDGILLKADVHERAEILHFYIEGQSILGEYQQAPDIEDLTEKEQNDLVLYLKSLISDIASQFQGAKSLLALLDRQRTVAQLIGFSAPYLSASRAEKQELLEMRSLHERGIKFLDLLLKQKESLKIQIEMANKFAESTNKQYRKQLLRQQLKEIQKELDEDQEDGKSKKKKDYRQLVNEAELPEYAKEAALEEVDKLEAQGPNSHEEGMIKTYLDLVLALPWNNKSNGTIDLEKAREVLNRDHYGLKDVKDRIIQHLAVMKLTSKKRGTILLLEGPPGTGKTSLGKSIAEALGRKYVRISLGGIRDEAEIRGHRRTYIGALPGRIISGMKQSGEKDAVFVLDEVDKLMTAYNGDPASALLEVLDPEQNNSFSDRYLDIPFDLSEVFFIATANSISTIPAPLLDRMEVIQITSYTNNEKFHIAKEHLVPSIFDEHGLSSDMITIKDTALTGIIEKYTREAGVRGLKKQIARIARVSSEKILSDKDSGSIEVTENNLEDFLGRTKVRLEDALSDEFPGVVTGLAWTPAGGDILFIESTFMPGSGELVLTGQLGEVMKESAKISLSLIRSRLAHQITHFDFSGNDIHIHVPAGSTPKDGPSAGITMFTSLASLLTGKTVKNKTAMTGEITLRGTVLPVGGIKEKVLAAHRAGIAEIILPRENEKDLEDIPEEISSEIKFSFADRIEDVIKLTLDIDLPERGIIYSEQNKDRAAPS